MPFTLKSQILTFLSPDYDFFPESQTYVHPKTCQQFLFFCLNQSLSSHSNICNLQAFSTHLISQPHHILFSVLRDYPFTHMFFTQHYLGALSLSHQTLAS